MGRNLILRKQYLVGFLETVYVRAVTDDSVLVLGIWSSVVTTIKPRACFLCVWPCCMLYLQGHMLTAPGTVNQSCGNVPTDICLIQEGE